LIIFVKQRTYLVTLPNHQPAGDLVRLVLYIFSGTLEGKTEL